MVVWPVGMGLRAERPGVETRAPRRSAVLVELRNMLTGSRHERTPLSPVRARNIRPFAVMIALMTRRREEVAAWAVSGGALMVALVLLAQDRQDRLVMLIVVISLGVGLLFDLIKRLARHPNADASRHLSHGEEQQ